MKTARLILTADQTASIVEQAGGKSIVGRCFAAIAPGTWPSDPGKLVLWLIECGSFEAANGGCKVARGELVATKPRARKTA